MPIFTDQLQRQVELVETPKKIISVVPSQTELLFDLGLDEEIAGITKFCVHPRYGVQRKIKVGGTKNLSLSMIHSIRPDLIIANKEENSKEQIEELANQYPVWISNIETIEDALQMITSIGGITGKKNNAALININIKEQFAGLQKQQSLITNHKPKRRTCAYLIWQKPYMAAGGDTFINEMIKYCGLKNIFEDHSRYPEINIEQLLMPANPGQEYESQGCELLLLSSEPYPFKKNHADELQPQLPGTKIILVDGEMFSWYGSRLRLSPAYFSELLLGIQ